MSTVKTIGGPLVQLRAACLDCKKRHDIEVPPGTDFLREMDEWQHKHWGHRIEFSSPRRVIPKDLDDSEFERRGEAPWWLEHAEFTPNANIKTAYASAVNMTITLAALATSAVYAGQNSTAIDETSNLYLDEGLAGRITTGTSPTVGEIDVYAYAAIDDVPTYPDTVGATDGAATITSVNILNAGFKLVAAITTRANNNETSPFGTVSLASLFGGFMPHKWGVFVTHNTVSALKNNSSAQQITAKPLYATST